MKKAGARIYVRGTVQGVGFRPFLFRLASSYGLNGYVRNLGDAGVEIHIEGSERGVERFINDLGRRAPPVCEVSQIQVVPVEFSGSFHKFMINPSDLRRSTSKSMIPPDIGICEQCVEDVFTNGSRWHLYPFTCCASCGPRFTAVYDLPYDRNRTNMADYPLCADCRREFEDPKDRRFHAQGICCSRCGPWVRLYSNTGSIVEERHAIEEAARLLEEGVVLGVKGIGGIHVAASAEQDEPLQKIRKTKRKPFQPFAVMSRDLKSVANFAVMSELEAQLLQGWRRPIVALKKLRNNVLSEWVAPGLDTVGVMLPYTGIHLLLTHYCHDAALVMTSGNISGVPMAITNSDALRQLSDVADYFLLHDRAITSRCDDSVVRVVGGTPTLIRRSRGFVPTPVGVPVKADRAVIGMGAELRNVGALLHEDRCYLTQHVGDVENLETLTFLEEALNNMLKLTGVSCQGAVIAHDAHPRYLTSRMAKVLADKWDGDVMSVQHHHAHAASLMADNAVPLGEHIVAIAVDGIGFGVDGDVWGGEILVASYKGFERVGHLSRQPMPGGDMCTLYPLRMCAAILAQHLHEGEVRSILLSKKGSGALREEDLDRIESQLASGIGVSWTSSAGRALDAMAAGSGVCLERTYEGEPAMRLEAVAAQGTPTPLRVDDLLSCQNDVWVVDTTKLLLDSLLGQSKASIFDACASFQESLAKALAQAAVTVAKERSIDRVGITGGVAVNEAIVETTRRCVEEEGLVFLRHRNLPPGDGGISVGQAVVAAASYL